MNGKPFTQLPANQIDEIKKDLRNQYQIEANALRQSYFSSETEMQNAWAKLNAKYQGLEYEAVSKIKKQLQEQERVREIIRQRTAGTRLSPEEEVTTKMNLSPTGRQLAFPQPTNWATEHTQNIQERNRLLEIVNAYTVSSSGKVQFTPKDNKGNLIENRPATDEEITLFKNSALALAALEKREREEIIPNLNPQERLSTRGQEIIQQRREKDFWEKHKVLRLFPPIGMPALAFHTSHERTTPLIQSVQEEKPIQKPVKVIRQRNTQTGQERISYDGGKTWQMVNG
jgi:hypothetical protein